MEFKADMHCHTTCSDGSLSPIDVLHLAKEKGLSGLSITDHDTIEAYDKRTLTEAQILGIELCPGVEFSTHHLQCSIHILGYAFDLNSMLLKEFCKRHQERRRHRNTSILRRLRFKGCSITEEDLYERYKKEKTVGRPHIALLMVERGFVKSIKEAFDKYIGDNKSCYDPGLPFTVEETIDVIHKAGGKAFIAHPHLIAHKKILKNLFQMSFDGLECYYSFSHHPNQSTLLQKAEELGWLVSGGSDFHGEVRPTIPLGASYIGRKEFDAIMRPT